jgi:cysteine sulfinate desulfinase/cysteine desulfurase-like protein
VIFHTDAVQAFGRVPASLREVPATLLSLSAHKLGGPAGAGVLFNKRGVELAAATPGHQENGRRGGTQSVVFAEAMSMALEHAVRHADDFVTHVEPLRDRFEREARDFHERVRECYLGMARSEPHRIRVVDASAPLVSVTAAVRSAVAGFVDRIAGSA